MLNNKIYDLLKAIGQIILPAVLTFFAVCGNTLNWEYTELVVKIGTAFITMWNSIIVVWNHEWQKEQEIQEK